MLSEKTLGNFRRVGEVLNKLIGVLQPNGQDSLALWFPGTAVTADASNTAMKLLAGCSTPHRTLEHTGAGEKRAD